MSDDKTPGSGPPPQPWFTVSLGAGVDFSLTWTLGGVATAFLLSVNMTGADVDLLDALIYLVLSRCQ